MSEETFYLDFERPIVELEKRIGEMEAQAETDGLDLSREIPLPGGAGQEASP